MALFSRRDKTAEMAKAVAEELSKAGMSGSPYANSGYSVATPAQGGQGVIAVGEQSVPLPRPGGAFGAILGPSAPLLPMPIDQLLDESGRPLPRRYEYQVATNLNLTQTSVPFGVLRSLTEQCDIIHRCIEIRVSEIVKMDWSFAPSPQAINDIMEIENVSHAKASRIAREKYGKQLIELSAFWENPYVATHRGWVEWMTEFLWQHFAYDGVPVYPRYNLGKKVIGFDIIDSPTIKVLLDNRGDFPSPPEPAYQQILWGFPRGEFTASENADQELYAGPGRADQFVTDQLAYFVRNRRTSSPYGYSSVEQCIPAATLYLERQNWMRDEFQAGSTPKTWMRTNSQEMDHLKLAAFERVLNDKLTGTSSERHRVKVLPDGFDPVQMAQIDATYTEDYDSFIIKRIASCFGVSPQQLGVMPRGGMGSNKNGADGEADNAETVSKKPMENFIIEVINSLSRRFLGADKNITFVLNDDQSATNEEARAKTFQIALASGQLTLNDVRGEIGMPLYDDPSADEPYAMTANGPVYFRGTMATDGAGETTVQIAPEADSAPSEPPLDVSPAKDEITAEQVAFKKFLSKRVKAGKWRDFEFVYVAPDLAEQLNEQGRTLVKGTDTPKAPGATRPHFSELPGHDAKQEIADYYAPIIRKALAVTGVAQAITQAMSALKAAKPEDKAAAQMAVTHNVKMDKPALLKAVKDLYGDAGLKGTKLAMDQLGGAAKLGSGINGLVGGINWDKWTPGHPEAALKVADGGLETILRNANVMIHGIEQTTLRRIGDIIAEGLAVGATASEIGTNVDSVLGDPFRSDMIALTETQRAFNASSMDQYQLADLPGFTWIAYEGACPECLDLEGDHSFGDDYPPAHPNCRCAIVGMATEYSTEE